MLIRTKHTMVSLTFILSSLLTIQGCKLGYNKTPKGSDSTITPPECAQAPANPNVDDNTLDVFNLLANLTCGNVTNNNDGFLMGQSTGYGNQISDTDQENSYASLMTAFHTETGKTPAFVSIDYEYDRLYTAEELIEANGSLEQHWDKGGFVTISWTPLNPWINNAEDKVNAPGTHQDTSYSDSVDLAELLDDSKNEVWRAKLDAVAEALANLQSRDDSVTVLWRPLPQMNSQKYWWGLNAMVNENNEIDASLYKNLWQDMYDYFTNDKALKNLLWVYSPAESTEAENSKIDWAYPGDDFVDVVAGIANNDQLAIKDYVALKNLNKPFGMAEYGPKAAGQFSANGSFDNQTYADRLDGSYQFVSYWISGHSTAAAKQALVHNQKSKELVERSFIFKAEDNKRSGL